MFKRLVVILAVVVLGLAPILFSTPVSAATSLPAGFRDSLIASVSRPVALAFTPDGRMLIASQNGTLWVYRNGKLREAPALDLTTKICSNSERGMLGVAIDPAFTANQRIYLYYTFKKRGVCDDSAVNRVSRFVLRDDDTVARGSEAVLIDNIPSPGGNHNGGDLQFGKDGNLYISVGDGGCDYRGDSGCQAANDASRDQHALVGKILRITTSGGIPASNPFTGSNSARCNTAGRTSRGMKCRETFAWGLRNPFRIAFDPNAQGTRFFINDVGMNVWEEIDLGRAGADYGWNIREGFCPTGQTSSCGSAPAGMTNPIYAYNHDIGCTSITGGAFVPKGRWPAAYSGAYLFADYTCGKIFMLKATQHGYERADFASNMDGRGAIALAFDSSGRRSGLFYTTLGSGGQVRRVTYVGN